jgi:hypothetical protein
MRSRAKTAFWIAGLILTVIVVSLIAYRVKARRRQAAYQSALASYAHDLHSGETRSEIQQYILAHRARAESDSEPDSPESQDILVCLGEEPAPIYCSRKVVYLQLKFDSSDKYADALLKTELQDCM